MERFLRRLVKDMLRVQHRAPIVTSLDKGNLMLANPDGVAGSRVLRDEVRRAIIDAKDADLRRLGVLIERVGRDLDASANRATAERRN